MNRVRALVDIELSLAKRDDYEYGSYDPEELEETALEIHTDPLGLVERRPRAWPVRVAVPATTKGRNRLPSGRFPTQPLESSPLYKSRSSVSGAGRNPESNFSFGFG